MTNGDEVPREGESVLGHGFAEPEEIDDDGEPDSNLRRGDCHHEEHEDLTRHAECLGQRDEGEVHGIEHQLHAHEDHDGVAPQEHPGDAEREEHRRHEERGAEQHQM